MATVHDVCKLASVSPSTVSRVLSGSTKISMATRNRVLAAIEKLNYRPDQIAKALVTQKSNTIGLIIPKGLPTFSLVMQSIDDAASAAQLHQKSLMTAFASGAPGSPIQSLDSLVNLQCEGILYMHNYLYEPNHGINTEAIDQYLLHSPIPIVVLDMKLKQMRDHCIWFDHQYSAALPVDYLASQGHKRIAYVTTYAEHRSSIWRKQGFISGMLRNGLEIDPSLFLETSVNFDGGYKAGLELIQKKIKFSAICCFNDKIAIGIVKALTLHAPELMDGLEVFGFGNDPLLKYLPFKIHSLDIPVADAIGASVQLLMKHMGLAYDIIENGFKAKIALNK